MNDTELVRNVFNYKLVLKIGEQITAVFHEFKINHFLKKAILFHSETKFKERAQIIKATFKHLK